MCSLMIDELAGWKARLMHQCEDFQESLQWIASEHQHLETNITATFRWVFRLLRVAAYFDGSLLFVYLFYYTQGLLFWAMKEMLKGAGLLHMCYFVK